MAKRLRRKVMRLRGHVTLRAASLEGRGLWCFRCDNFTEDAAIGLRHGDRANCAYADGHIGSHNQGELRSGKCMVKAFVSAGTAKLPLML